MRKVLTRYQVDPTFLSVLFSFGEMPHLAESGSSNIASIESGNGSRSKTSFLNQSQQILMSPERFLIRSDTLKRTTDHRTGPGLLDRRVSTITIPPTAISISSFCCTQLKTVCLSNNWPVMPRHKLPKRNWQVWWKIHTDCTSCHWPCTWTIGDGISGIWGKSSRTRCAALGIQDQLLLILS